MLTCASLSTNLSLKEPRSLTLLPFALQQCLPLMPSIVVFRTPNPTPPQLLFLVSPPLLALVALALSPVPIRRVPDAANAPIPADFLMARSVWFVPWRLLSWPMWVLSPRLPRPSHLAALSRFTALLWTILTLRLKTLRCVRT
jgi:hypothetical protein